MRASSAARPAWGPAGATGVGDAMGGSGCGAGIEAAVSVASGAAWAPGWRCDSSASGRGRGAEGETDAPCRRVFADEGAAVGPAVAWGGAPADPTATAA